MEHKIGEVFELNGVRLRVDNEVSECKGCYFIDACLDTRNLDLVGHCVSDYRLDKENIIFTEVKE